LVVNAEKETFDGEFQWCIRTDPPSQPPYGIITGFKWVRSEDKGLNFDDPANKNREWVTVYTKAQMAALEKANYITISQYEDVIKPKNSQNPEEVWRRFALTQQAFDYYLFMKRPLITRIVIYYWDKAENHVLSFVWGLTGAIAIEIILQLLKAWSIVSK
jgi:hypothetical protein